MRMEVTTILDTKYVFHQRLVLLPVALQFLVVFSTADNSCCCGASTLVHRPATCSAVRWEDAKTTDGKGGVFDIYPGKSGRVIEVYCDMETDGGGWMVYQRRFDGSVEFKRNWADYVVGFGDLAGEFWMGLEKLHQLVREMQPVEMRVDMEDWDGAKAYAYYTLFVVGDGRSKYALEVGGYSGDATDALKLHNNMKFSTIDQDNDKNGHSCSDLYNGGWWYNSCHMANPNGRYLTGQKETPTGITWRGWKNNNYLTLKKIEMKFRQKIF